MHLAYVDDSGGSDTFTLGCVIVEACRWPDLLDQVVAYRRLLRDRIGLPVRAEVKANHLLRNGGAFRSLALSERVRLKTYRDLLRLQAQLGLSVFAVVIRKDVVAKKGFTDPRAIAWEYILQRLERFTTKGDNDLLLFHDEGDDDFVRKAVRKARRAGSAGSTFGTGLLKRPARRLIDDPAPRQSHESYFIQFADLDAYAAYRSLYPPPKRVVQIVPQAMWEELGEARMPEVNQVRGGPKGIVVGP